jgi:hypothetical protein
VVVHIQNRHSRAHGEQRSVESSAAHVEHGGLPGDRKSFNKALHPFRCGTFLGSARKLCGCSLPKNITLSQFAVSDHHANRTPENIDTHLPGGPAVAGYSHSG